MNPIIVRYTDRTAEMATLHAELEDREKALSKARKSDKKLIMGQIRQIKRDIRRNAKALKEGETCQESTRPIGTTWNGL